MLEAVQAVMTAAGRDMKDLDLLVAQQANGRILERGAQATRAPR
jgi:3-oxoacyl-[acyl-carrier-protein] synthase III